MTDTEQVLLDFLFEKVGKNNQFTTKDLEKYASSTKTCEKFSKYYTDGIIKNGIFNLTSQLIT